MRVNDPLNDVIGKIVSGVVVAKSQGDHPRSQVYFVFSDRTALEFWGDQEGISMGSGLDELGVDQIVRILEKRPGIQIHVFRAAHEDPDARQRDMLTNDDKQM